MSNESQSKSVLKTRLSRILLTELKVNENSRMHFYKVFDVMFGRKYVWSLEKNCPNLYIRILEYTKLIKRLSQSLV